MTTPSTCTGQARLYSNFPSFLGPKDVTGLRFTAAFDVPVNGVAGWRVRTADFDRVLLPDVKTDFGTFTLVIALAKDATGSHTPATGALTAQVDFEFSAQGLPALHSVLRITLDTQAHTLRPGAVAQGAALKAASGAFALAGIGTFFGGPLNGYRAALQLDGSFAPPPP
jgi:hypothetical protein